jgi:hypothetical protein
VPACHALALEVGVIASYGRSGVMLSAADLEQCNAGVATQNAIRPGVRVTPSTPIRPARPQPSQSGDAAPPPASSSGAVTTNTTELSFVGGASVDTSDRAAPAIVTNTGELSFVGSAPVDTSDRAAPAVVVNTTELSFVGR